jgi:ATP-binding cassette subfamily A (ABC1) protein 3
LNFILRHNGAGKSTTISVLTGLIETTTGTVTIFGRNLHSDLPVIRQMIGYCPQHNVLFPTLSVQEHLFFFGKLKGLYGYYLRLSVDKVIIEVGIQEKTFVLASALSGGMKRKLSLAIALVGDPKFVLLDEPTSGTFKSYYTFCLFLIVFLGMDPYSRRSTWELIQRCKKGRVILLTTHFMEEADTLGEH